MFGNLYWVYISLVTDEMMIEPKRYYNLIGGHQHLDVVGPVFILLGRLLACGYVLLKQKATVIVYISSACDY